MSIANYRNRIANYNSLVAQLKGNLDSEIGNDTSKESGLGLGAGVGSIPLLMSGKKGIKQMYGAMKKSKDAKEFAETEGQRVGETSGDYMNRFRQFMSRKKTPSRDTLAEAAEGRIDDNAVNMDTMDFSEPGDIPMQRLGKTGGKYRRLATEPDDEEDDDGFMNAAFSSEDTPLLGKQDSDLSGFDGGESSAIADDVPHFNYADDLLKPIGEGSEATETVPQTLDLTPTKIRAPKVNPLDRIEDDASLFEKTHAELQAQARSFGLKSTGKGTTKNELVDKLGKYRDGGEGLVDDDYSSTGLRRILGNKYKRSPYLKNKYDELGGRDAIGKASKKTLIRDVHKVQQEESAGGLEDLGTGPKDIFKQPMKTLSDIQDEDAAGPSSDYFGLRDLQEPGMQVPSRGSQTQTVDHEQAQEQAANTAEAEQSSQAAETANNDAVSTMEGNLTNEEEIAANGGTGDADAADGADGADEGADVAADAGADAAAEAAGETAALTLGGALSGLGLVSGVGMGIFSIVELVKSSEEKKKQEKTAQNELPYISKPGFNATAPGDRNVSTSNV